MGIDAAHGVDQAVVAQLVGQRIKFAAGLVGVVDSEAKHHHIGRKLAQLRLKTHRLEKAVGCRTVDAY